MHRRRSRNYGDVILTKFSLASVILKAECTFYRFCVVADTVASLSTEASVFAPLSTQAVSLICATWETFT